MPPRRPPDNGLFCTTSTQTTQRQKRRLPATRRSQGKIFPPRRELRNLGYARETLPRQADALDRIRLWIAEGERVALTCYEALPCQCHRHCVAEALEKGRKRKLIVSHL